MSERKKFKKLSLIKEPLETAKERKNLKKWLRYEDIGTIFKEINDLKEECKKEGGFEQKKKLYSVYEIVSARTKIKNILSLFITNFLSLSVIIGFYNYLIANFKLFLTFHHVGVKKDHLKIVGVQPAGGGTIFTYKGYYSTASERADQYLTNIVMAIIFFLIVLICMIAIYLLSKRYKKILDFIDL
ncbi:MAG: hypothetical protein ABF539_09340 [Liquorilactobacillus nagelii]|uniref:hypothetical protein n=1 Tax=Liquorilactobacillus nagelii TaxID=82688 RepID=UPI0039EA20F0